VLPFDARRERRNGRDRRRNDHAAPALEGLEGRQLLSYSALGYSLPDLTVSGFAAPVAAWGGPLTVTVDVSNLGASSLIEPPALSPGAPSTADAGPSTVDVFLVNQRGASIRSVKIGSIDVPGVPQNNYVRLDGTFILPAKPKGFPLYNGTVRVFFRVDPDKKLPDVDRTNNGEFGTGSVLLEPALPDLAVVGLDVPPVMQPGDTIQPNIEIANFGTVDTATQGPVLVTLLATTNPELQGASVVATYTIESLHGLSEVPQSKPALGDVNIRKPLNIEVLQGQPVTLPITPGQYSLTVRVDPFNTIREIHELPRGIKSIGRGSLGRPSKQVGPPIPGLPPAGVLTAPSSPFTNPFPNPSFPVNASLLPIQPLQTITSSLSGSPLTLGTHSVVRPKFSLQARSGSTSLPSDGASQAPGSTQLPPGGGAGY
jgi:hypothetical protein